MKRDLLENKIIEYFEGELSKEETSELKRLLDVSSDAKEIFGEYQLIYEDLEKKTVYVPDSTLSSKFNEYLVEAIEENKPSSQPNKESNGLNTRLLYAIVGLLILIAGLLIGLNLGADKEEEIYQQNMLAMRTEMVDLLKENSTSTRIKAVNMVQSIEEPDEDVLDVLLETMDQDRSSNVRLAAVNALGRYTNNSKVKNALIAALSQESDPSIQISLINILSRFNDTDALKGFDKIIQDESTLKFVKDEAYLGKLKLETY